MIIRSLMTPLITYLLPLPLKPGSNVSRLNTFEKPYPEPFSFLKKLSAISYAFYALYEIGFEFTDGDASKGPVSTLATLVQVKQHATWVTGCTLSYRKWIQLITLHLLEQVSDAHQN